MIVLNPRNEVIVSDVTEKENEDESSFYTEKTTGHIYEVRFFSEYAMIRPVTVDTTAPIFRISLLDFATSFSEYLGDSSVIRDILWGEDVPEGMVIDRK